MIETEYMNTLTLKPEETIKKNISFTSADFSDKNAFHIAYGIDRNFLLGCGVSIASVLITNPNRNFHFHVFIDEINDMETDKFSQLAESYNVCIDIHIVDCKKLKELPTTKNWSVAMYFRFVIGDYFFGKQDKILYLDADVICNGDLSELITLNLNGKVSAVVKERDEHWWSLRAESLECPELEKGYFNSGVLLLNVNEWAQFSVSTKALEMLSNHAITKKLSYMDQDILNLILFNNVKFVDRIYNTQFSINYELKKNCINPITESTVFIHYVGPTKPWHEWANYKSTTPFLEAKKLSPWNNNSLLKPTNSNYARYCAKHKFKQHKPFSALLTYAYYFYLKVAR